MSHVTQKSFITLFRNNIRMLILATYKNSIIQYWIDRASLLLRTYHMIESGLNHKISHEATKGYQNASIISQQLILRYYYYQKCFINVISRVILYRLRYSKHSHKI